MSDDSQRPIIVKRIKKAAHGHHGGAWKIAYADFVTAMMAFFLLMWLLGSTTKADLQGISELLQDAAQSLVDGRLGRRRCHQHHQGRRHRSHRAEGQQKRAANRRPAARSSDLKKAEQELATARTSELLNELKAKIDAAISASPTLSQFKNQLLIDITTRGPAHPDRR